MRSRDKFKILNLIYRNTFCRQTCQKGDLLREGPIFKALISWSCDFHFLLRNLQVWNANA